MTQYDYIQQLQHFATIKKLILEVIIKKYCLIYNVNAYKISKSMGKMIIKHFLYKHIISSYNLYIFVKYVIINTNEPI